MNTHIQSTIPVLASLQIAETVAFYVGKLGFDKRMEMDSYAIVSRNGAQIHFWLCDDKNIAQNTSCYVRVQNANALYDEFTLTGLQLKPPTDQPWGMRELHVLDVHGNLLKFGEEL